MFYSHQLLARKAPLGQIWMAATMHAKINRRKLDKLNIIKICEEILYPSVPMALRLSGILMGGVVIVYERKVKILFDDVNRLLVEINEAWRAKPVPDRTVLPKGRTQAKYEAVTLPAAVEVEVEQSMPFPDTSPNKARFAANGFPMQLDDVDINYFINIDPRSDDPSQQFHQVDAANITLVDDFILGMGGEDLYNRFERFDIDGDEEDTHMDFTTTQMPSTRVPSSPPLLPSSPPEQEVARATAEESGGQQIQKQNLTAVNKCGNEPESASERKPAKRKTRANITKIIMDDEQLIISCATYQSWLQNTSDIVRQRKKVQQSSPIPLANIANSMEHLRNSLIFYGDNFLSDGNFPGPFLELSKINGKMQSSSEWSSGGRSTREAHGSPYHQLPDGFCQPDLPEYPVEDFQVEVGGQTMHHSIEKLRGRLEHMDFQDGENALVGDHNSTPGSSAPSVASNHSSGSGNTSLSIDPEVTLPSGRSKRRQNSSSANRFGSLDPVEEDAPLQENSRNFKLRRLSEKGPTPDIELLEETAPTQTPHQLVNCSKANKSVDKVTESIRSHLKVHFETPGAPEFESLDQLAFGMNRKKAAQLFYQTCVLATSDYVKVQQLVPYGDVSISRGPKM